MFSINHTSELSLKKGDYDLKMHPKLMIKEKLNPMKESKEKKKISGSITRQRKTRKSVFTKRSKKSKTNLDCPPNTLPNTSDVYLHPDNIINDYVHGNTEFDLDSLFQEAQTKEKESWHDKPFFSSKFLDIFRRDEKFAIICLQQLNQFKKT
jgi:hypothetical protein